MVFIVAGHQVYSPHMWGCFLTFVFQKMSKLVFPTHVGGVPREIYEVFESRYSPHMWGCFLIREAKSWSERVFPTHVGVKAGAPLVPFVLCVVWCVQTTKGHGETQVRQERKDNGF